MTAQCSAKTHDLRVAMVVKNPITLGGKRGIAVFGAGKLRFEEMHCRIC